MLNSQLTHLIETSYDRLKSREVTFQQYRENLAKAGVFRWVTNIHEHKRYYYTFDNSLLLLRAFRTLHKSLPLNHNVRFLPCQHRGVGIMQYIVRTKPCVHRFNYSRTLCQKFPVGAMDIVNPGIQWPDITWHTLININNVNFNSLFRVCLIFYTYDSANFKSIGNNTMKKMLLATAALYYRMCSTDVYCSKQTGSSSTKGNHHPSFLRFSELAKKNCRCNKFVARRKCC